MMKCAQGPLAAALAILLAACAWLATPTNAVATERPNVLFIAVDDLNHWVGFMGRNPQARTPNFDRLAARGVWFSNAHCAVPACNPSRAAIMSGMRPWNTACYTNQDPWKQHIPEGVGLTNQFIKAGYHVAGAGKIHHSAHNFYESEWSEYMAGDRETYHGRGVAKNEGFHLPLKHDLADDDLSDWHTVDWCIEQLNRPGNQPVFVGCGFQKPHLPFAVPRKYYEQFPLETIELPPYREDDLDDVPPAGVHMAKADGDHARFKESGRWKAAIQSYLATIAYVDMNLGRLLDGLEKSPRRDNTIIVLWGDHGWHFGEKDHWRKFALWEEATRAPLIFVAPGVTEPGGVCHAPVDFMSIYPTLCDLTGLPIPDHVEGKSIRPLLENPNAQWDGVAITTHGFKNHAVRSRDWRYIRYRNGDEELYRHTDDPYEWTNLAGAPAYASIIAEHAKWLPKKEAPPRRREKK